MTLSVLLCFLWLLPAANSWSLRPSPHFRKANLLSKVMNNPTWIGRGDENQSGEHSFPLSFPLPRRTSNLGAETNLRQNLNLRQVGAVLAMTTALLAFGSMTRQAAWASETVATGIAAGAVIPTEASLAAHRVVASGIGLAAEARLLCRLLFAALAGSALGWERSASKHGAGVRTMALVSLGASVFTIVSSFGFLATGLKYDPTRMAANVASGVGFIGAGVITTHSQPNPVRNRPPTVVNGLTTAAAVWISAAIGVASGAGLFLISGTASLSTIAILRIGRIGRMRRRSKEKEVVVVPQATVPSVSELEDLALSEVAAETIDSRFDERVDTIQDFSFRNDSSSISPQFSYRSRTHIPLTSVKREHIPSLVSDDKAMFEEIISKGLEKKKEQEGQSMATVAVYNTTDDKVP